MSEEPGPHTFAGSELEENWTALFRAASLFRHAAMAVAIDLGYRYPETLDRGVEGYLSKLRRRADG